MKTVLVTGANKGIGFEICRQLASRNFHVFLAARDLKKGETATRSLLNEFKNITFIQMDVSSKMSIEQAYKTFAKNNQSLDVLVNNAGILYADDLNPLDGRDDLFIKTLQTNAVGPLLISGMFSSLMKGGGRIINISSGGGSMNDEVGGWSPYYCISKTTLNAITRHLDYVLYPKGILVNTMDPGWVKTDMGGMGAPRELSQGAETAVWLATEAEIPHGRFIRDKKIIPW